MSDHVHPLAVAWSQGYETAHYELRLNATDPDEDAEGSTPNPYHPQSLPSRHDLVDDLASRLRAELPWSTLSERRCTVRAVLSLLDEQVAR